MRFDISKIPFSRFGSYFVISEEESSGRWYLRDLHGGEEAVSNIYEISFPGTESSSIEVEATETLLVFRQKEEENKRVDLVFGEENTVHMEFTGMPVYLKALGGKYDSLVPYGTNQWEHTLYSKERRILFTVVKGKGESRGTWKMTGTEGAGMLFTPEEEGGYAVLENYRTVWKKKEYPSFDKVWKGLKEEYGRWKTSMPHIPGVYEEETALASYLSWANFIGMEGVLKEPSMYSSKNWMFNIWSWDNCFSALPLSDKQPELAYSQLKVFYGIQDASGCYPDYVNDKFYSYSCCKPPIHAWTFQKMRRNNPYFEEKGRLAESYESFKRVAEYWVNWRIKRVGALPEYNHGNDSGWDNASVFHQGVPVESPDLTAYLIRQLDILSGMAEELGKEEDQKYLKETADSLFDTLMKRLYNGRKFIARLVVNGQPVTQGDSLLLYLPVVIGYRLPKEVLDRMVLDLEERFEAAYGLCTESLTSPCYKEGGYWLGPVWAPVTYIMLDALRENGYEGFARRLAEKFVRLAPIGLMAENYDPVSGKGYDDPAFSWTSCVFLQLLKEYPDMEEKE
ncbi:MAG: hypothetical protein E7243_22910 [Lacrimispora celerecrescens]|nr:hypothetical protein [Lacrimispora celerecrescens]